MVSVVRGQLWVHCVHRLEHGAWRMEFLFWPSAPCSMPHAEQLTLELSALENQTY